MQVANGLCQASLNLPPSCKVTPTYQEIVAEANKERRKPREQTHIAKVCPIFLRLGTVETYG